jgi:hypothetical protein
VQFQDSDYSEAGAMLADERGRGVRGGPDPEGRAPEPEIEMLRHKQILISALQLGVQPKDTLRRMMEKKVTAVAWDFIKDREGIYPDHPRHGRDRGYGLDPDRRGIPQHGQGRTRASCSAASAGWLLRKWW